MSIARNSLTQQTACETLGIDQAGFVERIRSSSSVRPQSSIASLILLAASLPPLQQQMEKTFSPPTTTLEDAMPVLSICLNGSAVDAATALAWSLVEKAKTGGCSAEFDQVTFLLEVRSYTGTALITACHAFDPDQPVAQYAVGVIQAVGSHDCSCEACL